MANFFTKFLARITAKDYGNGVLNLSGNDPFTIWGEGANKIPAIKAMDSYNGWVYACVRAIAEDIAGMKIKVYNIGSENEEIDQHDILDILSAPNALETGYNLLYKTSAHLELTGNAYWLLGGVKDEFSQPTSLTILNAGKIKAIISTGEFPKRLLGYKYREATKEYLFQPWEILHFQYPDPNDDFEGIGTVQTIAKWIDADNFAMEVNRKFFFNGARIGGYLESENAVTPAQLDYLSKSFNSIYQGANNAYKTAALPKGVKYTAASTTPKDMDFVNLSQEMQKRILGGFRVPKSVLGVTEDVNRANADASNYIFALRTIKPKMDQILSTLNSLFIPRFADNIVLSYEDPVPENTELKVKEMVATTAGHQVKTVNEVRMENYGMEPVDGGDVLSTGPAAPIPGAAPEGQKVLKVVRPASKKTKVAPAISIYHRTLKKRKALTDDLADRIFKNLEKNKALAIEIRKKQFKDITTSDWDILWKDFAARTGKFEKEMTRAMGKLNDEQKKEVIENLSAAIGKSQKAVNPKKLLNKDAAISATINLVQPIVTDIYKTEGEKAGELLGFAGMDITTQDAVKTAIADRVALMADSYTKTTLDTLAATIEAELVKGSSLADITTAVSNLYDEWNGSRAEMVARTESFAAANGATKEAWKQTGVVKSIMWYTAEDEDVCDWCGPMDGKEIKIDDNFYNQGDTITAGDQTMDLDYSDVGNPPLHVNCRCYIRPEEISIED